MSNSETTTLMKDKPLAVTEIAHGLVGGDRRGDYGHPLDDFCRTAVMWSALLKKRVTFVDVAQCMIALKQSREVNKQKQDNMIDACGYAECLDMCYTERDRRLKEGWTFDEYTGVWTKPVVNFDKVLEDLRKAPPLPDYQPSIPSVWPMDWPQKPSAPYVGDPLPGQGPTIICSDGVKTNG
jgi:hypothetical protein